MGLKCPRCITDTLEEIEVGSELLDRCSVCSGLWFDQGEVSRVMKDVSQVQELENRLPADTGTMDCPRCPGVRMRKQSLETLGLSSDCVYRCASCMGTWMDRGVLRRKEDQRLPEVLRYAFCKSE
jgi:MFS transporter, PAT family, beta-lactamase induction signal transducer AmpG